MNQNARIHKIAVALFGAVSLLFLLFFIYMGRFEHASVYSARDARPYTAVKGVSSEQIPDEAAPAGLHTVYRWRLDASGGAGNDLCFYLVHHSAQVYFDDELMYSLTLDRDNRIGDSVSSNWVMVPIYPEDAGKEVAVVLTPLFESVAGDEPRFLIGSRFSILFDQLAKDLPQLFVSMLCISVGLFIMAVQLYLTAKAKARPLDMFFMGSFSILLGVWRLTDTMSSPLLFSKNPMVLGYITIGVLFLCSIPLLHVSTAYVRGRKAVLLQLLSALVSAAASVVLLLQVLDVAEFKEMLAVSHIMLLVSVLSIAAMVLLHKKRGAGGRARRSGGCSSCRSLAL